MRNYAGTCKGICSYNLVYNFLIQLLPLKSSVALFKPILAWERGISKRQFLNEIVPLLVIFDVSYSKYVVIKIKTFSLLPHSCRSCITRVALASFLQHSCLTCVAHVSLVSHSRPTNVTRVAFVSLVSHQCRSCQALVL